MTIEYRTTRISGIWTRCRTMPKMSALVRAD
jgi:hypothetical protein